jgi:hypothetical protein
VCIVLMAFRNDELSFCGECGTLLPLAGNWEFVACPRCGFEVNIQGFGRLAFSDIYTTEFKGVQFTARSRQYAFQKPKPQVHEGESEGATVKSFSHHSFSCAPSDTRKVSQVWA